MKKITLLKSLLLGGILFTATSLFSQVNIAAGSTVTQNFDGLGTSATATLPTGWKVDKNNSVRSVGTYPGTDAGTATEQRAGNNMSSSATNGIYNFGAGDPAIATDRAIGGISSKDASKSVNVYVQLTNNGTTSINNFTISFDVEKYRKGTNSAGFTIQMYYSTDGSNWTSAGDDFKVSFAADADNNGYTSAPGATTSISGKTLSQSLAAGSSLYLAWNYSVTSGSTTSNAQALGIDNVSITANTGEAPATPTITVTKESLSGMTYVVGNGPSAEQSFQISGSNLTNDITLTPSANIEISTGTGASFVATSPITLTQSSGTVAATTIYVRLKAGLSAASYNETITATSGTTTKTINVAGSVTLPVVATPTFSPAAGTYTSAQSVTISCTTPGATIYYTTDGSTPDNTKTPYTGAISVIATTTIKAIAYATGYDPSAVASATYTINAVPTITVTEVTIPAFSATAGSSQDQTITVNGTNLTGDITLALSGTDADLFSLSQQTITPASGTVTDKIITITYAPTAPGSHAATLTLSSSGATDVIRNLTGTASLAQPTVNTPTNITNTGLTLNWNEVTGATEYEVNVYTKTTGTVTATDLFISEYVEGTSNNKALEIFNGTGADVDLSQYSLKKQTNGAGEYTNEKVLSGTLVNGDVYVIANSSASDAIKAKADLTENIITAFNGNDAIGLFKNGTQIDEVGVFNQVADWGKDVTLVRKSSVTSPKVPYDANEWESLATDNIDNLGSHTMDGLGTIKTPITGSPFTVSATSLQITGLTPATTYYYTVTAKNGSYVSSASDEASASTLGTATSNVAVRGIFVRNGQVVVTAPAAGERIEIFNAVGQRLVSKLSTEGENTISVSAKGVLVVKFGSGVTKVILP